MVALAPAIGALVGVGATSLWQARLGWAGRVTAAVAVAVTGWWSYVLLDRTPSWLPWLRPVVLIAGLVGAAALLAVGWLSSVEAGPGSRLASALGLRSRGLHGGLDGARAGRRLGSAGLSAIVVVPALIAGLAGPLAYSLDTVNSTHTGSIPSAGPTVTGSFGGPGGVGGGGGGGLGGGGLSGNTQVSSTLTKLLEQDASTYRWIAATEGSQEAAPIELATGGLAVLAIGGFNGSDPAPALAEFESIVAKDEIHYYVGRGAESFGGGSGSSAIASWVAAHFKAQTVGGVTVYDLTTPS
jgi:hypothetical protein